LQFRIVYRAIRGKSRLGKGGYLNGVAPSNHWLSAETAHEAMETGDIPQCLGKIHDRNNEKNDQNGDLQIFVSERKAVPRV
jgi:hypothetical protein